MPKLRHQVVFVAQWIDAAGSIDHMEIFQSAKSAALAAANDGGDPAMRDLCVVHAGYYAKRGGPVLAQERQLAYFRLRGVWSVPTHYIEGGTIPLMVVHEIAELVETFASRRNSRPATVR